MIFERYVGRQLSQLPSAELLQEIVFDNDERSVDWFAIFDEAVLLIEVKSTRLTEVSRMGGVRLADDVKRCLGKAFEQLDRTEELIRDRHLDFVGIPTDRRHVGLVVTLAPYWHANTPMIRRLLAEPTIPTTVASIREVEYLVTLIREHGLAPFLEVVDDPERREWNLGNALGTHNLARNPVLEEAWLSLPISGM